MVVAKLACVILFHREMFVKAAPFRPEPKLLIAQAKVEGLTVVSHDRIFHQYRIPIIEA